ncbi:hypothetical protein [Streptomyces sp. NPDC088246]|uniref:hypothetical protein n=1 Tax=Streptomyces sp. NPDC088246 TaxID=3365842 RepID=UPI00382BE28F
MAPEQSVGEDAAVAGGFDALEVLAGPVVHPVPPGAQRPFRRHPGRPAAHIASAVALNLLGDRLFEAFSDRGRS